MVVGFHYLEHPADIGVEACGATPAEVFEQAARGLVSIIVEPSTVEAHEYRQVEISGSEIENLLVNWLSEIVYQYDGKSFLVSEAKVTQLTPTHLVARLGGESVDIEKHRFRMDVKAVTYHQLVVEETPGGFLARFFVDI